MFCLQDKDYSIFCDAWKKSYIDKIYHTQLGSQPHINIFNKKQNTLVLCNSISKLIKCRYKWKQKQLKI